MHRLARKRRVVLLRDGRHENTSALHDVLAFTVETALGIKTGQELVIDLSLKRFGSMPCPGILSLMHSLSRIIRYAPAIRAAKAIDSALQG